MLKDHKRFHLVIVSALLAIVTFAALAATGRSEGASRLEPVRPVPVAGGCPPLTFTNAAPVTIADLANANPYPSGITVSGVGTIPAAAGSLQVTINGFGHTFPDDVGLVLVGPTGAALLVQDGAGHGDDMAGVTYTLSDTGAAALPGTGTWTAGTYKPAAYYTGDSFPSPGPGTTYGQPGPAAGGTATFSSVFGGTNANGTWNLYIVDFALGDAGSMSGGWTLTFANPACPTPSPTPSVSGKISYKNTLTAGYPVPNTLLSGAGSPNVSATSAANGNYSLTGFGPGAYTVTPSKTPMSDLTSNGITVDDAALIARHVVGLETLTDEQKEAARVLGDPVISTSDAAYIARWVVGFNDAINQTGDWKFTPASRPYLQVVGNNTAQDYAALLMGDVNRDWLTGPAARPYQLVDPTWKTPVVSIDDATAVAGTTVTIPVRIDNLAGRGLTSYQFGVEYDPRILAPVDADVSGTISAGLSVTSNERLPGLFKVAVFGAYPVLGDGVYIYLAFKVTGKAGAVSPLRLQGIRLNDGADGVIANDGSVKILAR